ncbi:hypothetical protein N7512_007645 [Penicillium capsulatum]|nr:hypothetical protein N7512_007645 [Penicillium capsulatum]
MGGPDPDRNSRVKFMKRCKTLKTKARQLADLCGANVYLVIAHPRELYAFNSVKDGSWPPPDEVLEQHYPTLRRETCKDRDHSQERSGADLKQLTQYFATRWQFLNSLERSYNTTQEGRRRWLFFRITIRSMETRNFTCSDGPANNLSYESLETRYVRMIVEADEIPWQYNILASVAHWILLAGYLVIPGTFTSLQRSDADHNGLTNNKAGEAILNTIQNPPLLVLACIFFVAGLLTMGCLYWEHRSNYIWLINRIFMPTLLNALAGLLTTIINLYTAHNGDWSIMALLTVIASGLSVASSLSLVIVYKFGKLERLKQEHNQRARTGIRPSCA